MPLPLLARKPARVKPAVHDARCQACKATTAPMEGWRLPNGEAVLRCIDPEVCRLYAVGTGLWMRYDPADYPATT